MKTLYCCIFTLISINLLQSQIPQGQTWLGDYRIESQAEADAFIEQCQCTSIDGNLIISGEDIIHLDSLSVLKEVRGSVEVIENPKLENCYGLTEITYIGLDFIIDYNNSLTKLNRFSKLEIVGKHFNIIDNNRLIEISGFGGLTYILSTAISSNDSLSILNGFNQLQTGSILLNRNAMLANFNAFNGLHRAVKLHILNNASIQKIEGFKELNSVRDLKISNNPTLKEINGFYNLEVIDIAFQIDSNEELHTISGFNTLHSSGFGWHNTHFNIFSINSNPKIKHIEGFELLKKIRGNCQLNFEIPIEVPHLFNNLKTINGSLVTNLSHFQKLDSIGKLIIADNLDTLTGFPKLKNAEIINIENSNLKQINNAFPVLEKVENIEIKQNNILSFISGFSELTEIDGTLTIEDNSLLNSINAFHQLESINDDLFLKQNSKLTNLEGFDSLTWITRQFVIAKNNSLKKIEGFQNLTNVYDLAITDNDYLEVIHEFEQLQTLGRLFIDRNIRLTTIPDFNNLTQLNELKITSNLTLKEIHGYNNIDILSSLDIRLNANLNEITGFNDLQTIQNAQKLVGNTNLVSIKAFNQLVHVAQLYIINRNLRNLDAFSNLKSVDKLQLSENIHLRSIDNFLNVRIIKDDLRLSGNLQLNGCCLVNCWINDGVIDASKVKIDRNGMNCIDLSSINENCKTNVCKEKDEAISDLHILRNPVIDYFHFNFISYNIGQVEYSIYNLQEQVIVKGNLISELGYNLKGADLTSIERGFYFLVLQANDTKIVAKFIKQ